MLGDQYYDILEEFIVDLKNLDKDCSYMLDMFLVDIDGFVQIFYKGFVWYYDLFCIIVFLCIFKVQFEFVWQCFESIFIVMEELLN